MQKRHLVVSVMVVVASLISYALVQFTEAHVIRTAGAELDNGMALDLATPTVALQSEAANVVGVLENVPDAAIMFAAGASLLAIAATLRRHA
jgi:hypothetical protein